MDAHVEDRLQGPALHRLDNLNAPMPHAAAVPEDSFLATYSRGHAYTDCYITSANGVVSLCVLIEAFYTTPLFKLERWVLATLFKIRSTDVQARQIALAQSTQFAAWKVERRSAHEILLDAGQTRLWLCVAPASAEGAATSVLFGSAVVPMRPDGKFGPAFHALLGFHRLYSKLLLSAAVRRIPAIARSQNVAAQTHDRPNFR